MMLATLCETNIHAHVLQPLAQKERYLLFHVRLILKKTINVIQNQESGLPANSPCPRSCVCSGATRAAVPAAPEAWGWAPGSGG